MSKHVENQPLSAPTNDLIWDDLQKFKVPDRVNHHLAVVGLAKTPDIFGEATGPAWPYSKVKY